METQTLTIPNISCGHCVAAVKDELTEIDGVASVEGDPGEKTVTVKWNGPATLDTIKEKLIKINYPAEP